MDELIEGVLWLVVVGAALVAIFYLSLIPASIAAAFGGCVSLYNYGLAFKNNVKPEQPTI